MLSHLIEVGLSCHRKLKQLAKYHSNTLRWASSHSEIGGNELTDGIAKAVPEYDHSQDQNQHTSVPMVTSKSSDPAHIRMDLLARDTVKFLVLPSHELKEIYQKYTPEIKANICNCNEICKVSRN